MPVSIDDYFWFNNKNILIPKEFINEKNKNFSEKFKKFINIDQEIKREKIPENLSALSLHRLYNLSNLALEVTENCDLNCRYCVYSGIYKDQRTKSEKNMCFQTAKKAVDYYFSFLENNVDKRTLPLLISIGFYGGEPFFNFELIKQVVEYSKDYIENSILLKKNNTEITFVATTNGVATKKYIDFIVKTNLKLSVSIDGPEEINNKNRGDNTFKHSMGFLETLYKEHHSYFKRNVSVIAVYAPDTNLNKIAEFFSKKIFNECLNLTFGDINPSGLKNEKFHKNNNKRNDSILMNLVKKTKNGNTLSRIENRIISKDFKFRFNMLDLEIDKKKWEWCTQGSKRLFVDVSGNFYGCEKVGRSFKIGNVDEGFNFDSILLLDKEWSLKSKRCHNCIYKKFCSPCLAHMGEENKLLVDNYCKRTKESINEGVFNYVKYLKI